MTIQHDGTILAWLADKSVNLWRRDWSDKYTLVADETVMLVFSHSDGVKVKRIEGTGKLIEVDLGFFVEESKVAYCALAEIDLLVAEHMVKG